MTIGIYSCGGSDATLARMVAGMVTGRDGLTDADGGAMGGFIVDLENETLK